MQLVEPRPNRPIPIRITPLIDVVFILLVFFMLTSRLMPVGYIELGNSTNRSPAAGDPLPVLTVTGSGNIQWQDKTLPLNELTARLKTAGIPEANLATRPETDLGQFTQVLSRLDELGIKTHWKRAATKAP